MGILDSIGLTGTPAATNAANATRAALSGYGANTANIYNTYGTGAQNALLEGRTGALGALGSGLQNQLGAFSNVTTDPLQQAVGAAQGGVGGAVAAGQGGVAAYDPLAQLGQSYQPAIDKYYAALGLMGPEAAAAAKADFLPSTGYSFQQQQATREALAQASKLGIGQSGNTAAAITQRASDIAGAQWADYLNRLQGFVNPQLQATQAAASGRAGAYGTLGNLGLAGTNALTGAYSNLFQGQRGLATDLSGVYGTNAQNVAGTYTGYGQDVSNVLGNIASGQAQSARDIVQGNIAANNQVAQAQQQDVANYWGAIGAGIGAVGSAFGGGSLGKIAGK